MSERVQLAMMLAETSGRKIATEVDYRRADQFLDSELVRAHDRRVARETLEDAAFKIPDTCEALQNGESATHWLSRLAGELA